MEGEMEGEAQMDTDPREGPSERMVVRQGERKRYMQGGGEMRKLGGIEGKPRIGRQGPTATQSQANTNLRKKEWRWRKAGRANEIQRRQK